MSGLIRDVIRSVMSDDPTALVIWGIAFAAIIALIVFLRSRRQLFDPLTPPTDRDER